jgi:hypothetical protein
VGKYYSLYSADLQTDRRIVQSFGPAARALTNPAVLPNPIDLDVTTGDNKLSIATGDGKMLAPRMASNNKIPLKFAKEFVGDYSYYPGDLFLVHKSGPLARLNCSRT